MPPHKAPKKASAAAAAPGEGRDHITSLPDGVLQHILSFLPAQDVVRTCVLAKCWRHLWKSTTVLRFVCGGMNEPKSVQEIQEFVDHLLRLRISGAATPLDTCKFRLREDEEFDMSRFILWIRIALQCKVRVLHLCMCTCREIHPLDDHPFFISQYLKKLKIRGLNLVPSKFLDLSCCSSLEDLEIVGCCLWDHLSISSQSLKRLTIRRGYFSHEMRMPICAPNLVSLCLQVHDGRTPLLQRMPSLLTAFVEIQNLPSDVITLDSDDGSNQSILLQGLSEVQNLVLISPDTEMFVLRRDLQFCSSFNKLKYLLLDEYWCEPTDFSALACLLKLSPVLEKLTLQLYSEGPEHEVEIKLGCKPLELSAATSQHLKTIEVKCEVLDEKVYNVLTFLRKQLNIWFQFNGYKALYEDRATITLLSQG